MKKKMKIGFYFVLSLCLGFASALKGEEKPSSFEEEAKRINQELLYVKKTLKEKYERAPFLYEKRAGPEAFEKLKAEIQALKDKKEIIEERFRQFLTEKSQTEEAYAFWDQGETTLGQLIVEYGSSDFLYIIPADVSNIKLNMSSALAIPHESFEEIIEMILFQNGIGIKKLTPYLRQLFILKQNPGFIEYIATDFEKLKLATETSLVFYLLQPASDQIKSVLAFLEKFSDPKETTVQIVGSKIAIVSMKKNVEKLLMIYEAAYGDSQGKSYQLYNLKKLEASEAEKIVQALFMDTGGQNRMRPPFLSVRVEEIGLIPLPEKNALVFIGEEAKVQKALELLKEVEAGLSEDEETVFFWYTCQHSDPQEMADLLNRLFADGKEAIKSFSSPKNKKEPYGQPEMRHNFANPGKVEPKKSLDLAGNIVVDVKTSSLLMLVKKEAVKNLETVLKKIDVPKKMVQIEVLLVERTLRDSKQTGINLLKIGAKTKSHGELDFDAAEGAAKRGILDFIYSHSKGYLPSFDLAMSFLLAQEDIKINASPSILAVNQTPAKISLVEESSINTGAVRIEGSKNVENAYERVQYGTTIVITPTIHLPENENEKGYVTMQTNIQFDSQQKNARNDRPPVTRRHIENEVCIADGETIVLGGLRSREEEDSREKIPFLGELPGIGKLFGSAKLIDNSTEMFIFITPRIIKDPRDSVILEREKELKKRPGDIPEFLQKLEEAKQKEKKKLFEDSLKVLFENF